MSLPLDVRPSVAGAQGPRPSLEQQNRRPTVIGYFSTGKPMYLIEGGCNWVPTIEKRNPDGKIIYQQYSLVRCENPGCPTGLPIKPEDQDELPELQSPKTLKEYVDSVT